MQVTLTRVGYLIVANGETAPSTTFSTGGLQASETIPAAFRPSTNGTIVFVSNNGGTSCSWKVDNAGKITLRGRADQGYYQTANGSWAA